jgi:hypothetical protein
MSLSEALAAAEDIPEKGSEINAVVVESDSSEESVSEAEAAPVIVVREETESPQRTTRSGRLVKRPKSI